VARKFSYLVALVMLSPGVAFAASPTPLTSGQMDGITAGLASTALGATDLSTPTGQLSTGLPLATIAQLVFGPPQPVGGTTSSTNTSTSSSGTITSMSASSSKSGNP